MTERRNAFAAYMAPSVELEDEIKRLVRQFGVEAVRLAVKRIATLKRGRKAEEDLPAIIATAKLDARDWLEGRDPSKLRSNYRMAGSIAKETPGHNVIATKSRIERKLRKYRLQFMYIIAAELAAENYPWSQLVRARQAIVEHDARWAHMMEVELRIIARYREDFGEPDPNMTFAAIEMKLAEPTVNHLLSPRGLLSKPWVQNTD